MIDPKQKAEAIVDKYKKVLHDPLDIFKVRTNAIAKECAKIHIEGILEAVTTIADKKYEYWQEVLNELNKM